MFVIVTQGGIYKERMLMDMTKEIEWADVRVWNINVCSKMHGQREKRNGMVLCLIDRATLC